MSNTWIAPKDSGAAVDSVTGMHGVTVSPTTGNVVVSGVNATTSSVGVASFNSSDFTVNGSGQVSLNGSIVGSWIDEAASFNAIAGNGYFVTATSTATLPASPTQGQTISFEVDSISGILTIQANTGQIIQIGKAISVSAGIAVSNFNGDSVTLVYRSADTSWRAISCVGTFTIT